MIRALANQMQERAYGRPSLAMERRLNTLAGEFEKGRLSFDPGVVLKSGAKLVREWRGRAYTVVVLENGFEYEGQRYRSLTMIAARITGAHWSGPRFFGLIKRASRSLSTTGGHGVVGDRDVAGTPIGGQAPVEAGRGHCDAASS